MWSSSSTAPSSKRWASTRHRDGAPATLAPPRLSIASPTVSSSSSSSTSTTTSSSSSSLALKKHVSLRLRSSQMRADSARALWRDFKTRPPTFSSSSSSSSSSTTASPSNVTTSHKASLQHTLRNLQRKEKKRAADRIGVPPVNVNAAVRYPPPPSPSLSLPLMSKSFLAAPSSSDLNESMSQVYKRRLGRLNMVLDALQPGREPKSKGWKKAKSSVQDILRSSTRHVVEGNEEKEEKEEEDDDEEDEKEDEEEDDDEEDEEEEEKEEEEKGQVELTATPEWMFASHHAAQDISTSSPPLPPKLTPRPSIGQTTRGKEEQARAKMEEQTQRQREAAAREAAARERENAFAFALEAERKQQQREQQQQQEQQEQQQQQQQQEEEQQQREQQQQQQQQQEQEQPPYLLAEKVDIAASLAATPAVRVDAPSTTLEETQPEEDVHDMQFTNELPPKERVFHHRHRSSAMRSSLSEAALVPPPLPVKPVLPPRRRDIPFAEPMIHRTQSTPEFFHMQQVHEHQGNNLQGEEESASRAATMTATMATPPYHDEMQEAESTVIYRQTRSITVSPVKLAHRKQHLMAAQQHNKHQRSLSAHANPNKHQQQQSSFRRRARKSSRFHIDVRDIHTESVETIIHDLRLKTALETLYSVDDGEAIVEDELLGSMMAKLHRGGIFLKYGRRGNPHLRRLWVTADMKTLRWAPLDAPPAPNAFILVKDIDRVVAGASTSVFISNIQQKKLRLDADSAISDGANLRLELEQAKARCFSLEVLNFESTTTAYGRSVNLQVMDGELSEWVKLFQFLVDQGPALYKMQQQQQQGQQERQREKKEEKKHNLSKAHAHRLVDQAIRKFNLKPMEGLRFARENKLFQPLLEREEVQAIPAWFGDGAEKQQAWHDAILPALFISLMTTRGLDREAVGEFLGKPAHAQILRAYISRLDFADLNLVDALRFLFLGFKPAGEAQVIDRIMSEFAKVYHAQLVEIAAQENKQPLLSEDSCYILSFSLLMLNTDLHSAQVKHKMTLDGFVRNNRGIGDKGCDIDPDYLSSLYEAVLISPIKMEKNESDVGTLFVEATVKGWLSVVLDSQKLVRFWAVLSEEEDDAPCIYFFSDHDACHPIMALFLSAHMTIRDADECTEYIQMRVAHESIHCGTASSSGHGKDSGWFSCASGSAAAVAEDARRDQGMTRAVVVETTDQRIPINIVWFGTKRQPVNISRSEPVILHVGLLQEKAKWATTTIHK